MVVRHIVLDRHAGFNSSHTDASLLPMVVDTGKDKGKFSRHTMLNDRELALAKFKYENLLSICFLNSFRFLYSSK